MLLVAQARNAASPRSPASLFEQIYRPARPPLPAPVTDALLALAQARESYRLEHAAARRTAGTPAAPPHVFARMP